MPANRDTEEQGQAVMVSQSSFTRRLASHTPFLPTVLAQAYVWEPMVRRLAFDPRGAILEPFRVDDVLTRASEELRRAVAAAGGAGLVQRQLRRSSRMSGAVGFAIGLRGAVRQHWEPHLEVHGFEDVRQTHQSGRPTLIVFPHIGPTVAAWFHLLSSGIPVTDLTNLPADLWAKLGRPLMWVAGREATDLEVINTRFPGVGPRMAAAFRRHRAVIWQPDIFASYQEGQAAVQVRYLGETIAVSPMTYRLVKKFSPRQFLATAILQDGRRPAVRLTYRALELPADDELAYMRRLYAAVNECLLEHVDQAWFWHWFGEIERIRTGWSSDSPNMAVGG